MLDFRQFSRSNGKQHSEQERARARAVYRPDAHSRPNSIYHPVHPFLAKTKGEGYREQATGEHSLSPFR